MVQIQLIQYNVKLMSEVYTLEFGNPIIKKFHKGYWNRFGLGNGRWFSTMVGKRLQTSSHWCNGLRMTRLTRTQLRYEL